MELSYRLSQIADLVTPGTVLADIGTDHGYIPIKLVLEEKITNAIAMDIGAGPLKRAEEHIEKYHLQDKIQCRLSNGLQKLHQEEADTIVIAGMGGDLMAQICEQDRERFISNKEFILQPQSEYYKVRRQMHSMGYSLIEERFFQDEGKYYVCMKAVPGEERYEKECEYVFGRYLLLQNNEVLKQYIQFRLQKVEEIYENILSRGNAEERKPQTLHKLEELQREKDVILEALSYY